MSQSLLTSAATGLIDRLCAELFFSSRVPDDETNRLVSALRLSGVTRGRNGCLEGRNRIYERVFDLEWIRANMPDAEVRRQKLASRRGVTGTAGRPAHTSPDIPAN